MIIPDRSRNLRVILNILVTCVLSGCASYQKAPLDLAVPLKPSVAMLNHRLPAGGVVPTVSPLRAGDVVALALLNNPQLIAARAQHNVAKADLLSAGMLPDPVFSGGFSALLGGPGDAPSIAGSLTEDVSALITYSVNKRAARAGLAQVDAGVLWQEWQVAAQVEQLCITIDGDVQTLAILQAERAALAALQASTSNAVASGNLTLAEASSSMAALAAMDTVLNTQQQTLAQDRDQLDALLGLQPGIPVAVTLPAVPQIDPTLAKAEIASLATRRPDLIALRFGYEQADARLRAAILTQFLPVTIGPSGGRDTTKVFSAGPTVTLTLPLFNRNRGGIASASATRAQLAAQFQASLAGTAGDAGSLLARIALLQAQSAVADANAANATNTAVLAQSAFKNGNLDALSAVNLQTASADRQREAIALRVELDTARLSLATLLGVGLPSMAHSALEPNT